MSHYFRYFIIHYSDKSKIYVSLFISFYSPNHYLYINALIYLISQHPLTIDETLKNMLCSLLLILICYTIYQSQNFLSVHLKHFFVSKQTGSLLLFQFLVIIIHHIPSIHRELYGVTASAIAPLIRTVGARLKTMTDLCFQARSCARRKTQCRL